MQRLVLAVLLLGLLAAGGTILVLGLREAFRQRGIAAGDIAARRGLMERLAFVVLFALIFGVSAGWLGGL